MLWSFLGDGCSSTALQLLCAGSDHSTLPAGTGKEARTSAASAHPSSRWVALVNDHIISGAAGGFTPAAAAAAAVAGVRSVSRQPKTPAATHHLSTYVVCGPHESFPCGVCCSLAAPCCCVQDSLFHFNTRAQYIPACCNCSSCPCPAKYPAFLLADWLSEGAAGVSLLQLPGASATLILENVVLRGSPGVADWLPSGQRNGGQGSALAVSPCMSTCVRSVPMCSPICPIHAQLTLSLVL